MNAGSGASLGRSRPARRARGSRLQQLGAATRPSIAKARVVEIAHDGDEDECLVFYQDEIWLALVIQDLKHLAARGAA
jgi:hypothetical protein